MTQPEPELSDRDPSVGGRRQRTDPGAFLKEFLRAPARTGAIAPSSRQLATAITAPIPERGDPVVVELGPGTGVFTEAIQRRLAGRGRHLAVELNPLLAGVVAARYPGVEVVTADAARLSELLAERGLAHADVVVSGLPWAAFPAALQQAVLTGVARVLPPDGAFTTFAYVVSRWTPPARGFRRRLTEMFEEVVLGRTIMGNLPPAFVYHARRPRDGAAGPR